MRNKTSFKTGVWTGPRVLRFLIQACCASCQWVTEIFFKLNSWPDYAPEHFKVKTSWHHSRASPAEGSLPIGALPPHSPLPVAEPEAGSPACISVLPLPPLPDDGGCISQCHGSWGLGPGGDFPSWLQAWDMLPPLGAAPPHRQLSGVHGEIHFLPPP